MDRFSDRGSTPLISTIVEPVEPKGLAGFSLCSKVGGIDDMPVSNRHPLSRRQAEIPTILGVRIVGIIVLRIFVEDLDLIIEQDDLVHEGVDQALRFGFQRIEQEGLRFSPVFSHLNGWHLRELCYTRHGER